MRISVKPTDPGYTQEYQRYRIYVGGKRLRYCLTADEETGEAFVMMTDPTSYKPTKVRGGYIEMKLTGAVRIVDTTLLQHVHYQGERQKNCLRSRLEKARAKALENMKVRTCRVCGCTDYDCTGCIERTGIPCHWVEDDLCSACV